MFSENTGKQWNRRNSKTYKKWKKKTLRFVKTISVRPSEYFLLSEFKKKYFIFSWNISRLNAQVKEEIYREFPLKNIWLIQIPLCELRYVRNHKTAMAEPVRREAERIGKNYE